jgi:site-specific recombinase XerD
LPDADLSQATLFIAESKHFKDRYVPIGQSACRFLACANDGIMAAREG